MYNESKQAAQCDLENTPRQYDACDFNRSGGNEDWGQPNMFRNMTYANDTDAQCSQLCGPLAHNLGTMQMEQLSDMTPPTWELSPMCDDTAATTATEPNMFVDSLYQEIVNRFDELRQCIARGETQPPSQPNDSCDVYTTQQRNGIQTTLRKVTTLRDQCGNVTGRLEETSTVSNAPPSEQLAEVSMPTMATLHDDSTVPAMSTRLAPQQQQSERIADTSAPPMMCDSTGRSNQATYAPSRTVANILAPSFGTNVCLEDVSAPSFAHSTTPRPCSPAIIDVCETGNERMRQQQQQQPPAPSLSNKCLDNVTMPSFGTQLDELSCECLDDNAASSFVRNKSTRRQQRPLNICDVMAPSFGSSSRGAAATNACLEDMSMPSFGGVSGAGRARTLGRQQRSMPSQQICDISAPPMPNEYVGDASMMTNECLQDMSMPTFGQVSGAGAPRSARRQPRGQNISMCLDNMTMPSFGGVSGSSRRQQTMPSECLENVTQPSFGNSRSAAMTSECLDNMPMPSFGGVSGSSRRQQTMPSECLENISQPSYRNGRSAPMTSECLDNMTMPSYGASRRQPSMPLECLENISQPSYGNSRSAAMTNACLDNVTMPSFGGVSGSQRRQPMMPSECLDNMTMPSFGGVSGSSRRQQTMTLECLDNITQPSFANSRSGAMTNECLDNMTMPSFGGVSGSSRRQQTMPAECLENITQPSYGNSRSAAMTNECLDNVTMPSFGGVSLSVRRQQTMPSECLDNITEPSSFGNSRSAAMTNECLDNMTMPSFGGVSGSSRRQQVMPLECLDNVTPPTFGASMQSRESSRRQQPYNQSAYYGNQSNSMPSECLQDVSAPGFGGRSRTPGQQQQRSMATPNICDVTAPSFGSSHRGGVTSNPCLDDMSMPSFGGVSGASRGRSMRRRQRAATLSSHSSRRQQMLPSECLNDVSQPSFEPSLSRGYASQRQPNMTSRAMNQECLDNMTMPSFGGVSGASNRPINMSMPSECLDDVSAPSSFGGRSRSARQAANMCDMTGTSFGNSTQRSARLDDVSMPSFAGIVGASRGRSVRRQQRSQNECLENMTMPSFAGISGASRRQQALPSECLDNVTQPSFGERSMYNSTPHSEGVSFGRTPIANRSARRQQRAQNICDITEPSFGSSSRGATATNVCLEDMSMPSFGGVSGAGRVRTPARQQRQQICDTAAPAARSLSQGARPRRQQRTPASQNICDISAPSYYSSGRSGEWLDDMTMPAYNASFGRTPLWDVTVPELESNSYPSYTRQPRNECLDDVPSECLNDVTMPLSMRRTQSFPCVSSQQQLGGDAVNELYNSYQRQPMVDADVSYPREMLGNISAPSYASNLSEPHRSCVLLWADRSNAYDMPSENIDQMTAPTMFNSTRGDDYTGSSTKRGRSRGPPEQRLNFARSTAIGEDSGPGNAGTAGDSNDPPCQCPASEMSVKTLDNANSQMRQNASDKLPPNAAKSVASAGQQNNGKEGDAKGAGGKKEVTIIASVTSMTRIYMKKPGNEERNYENINDITMPDLQSSNNNNNNNTMFINNISEPTYGPSLQASSYSNLSCTPTANQGVYNYAQQTQMGTTSSSRPCTPLSTPQPVRGQQNNAQKCVPNNRTETKAKCCCSNNCRRYRKSRQNAKNRSAPC